MKEFHIKNYIKDKEFNTLIMNVINSNSADSLMVSLVQLDAFVSKVMGVDPVKIVYDDIKELGLYDFDPVIIISRKYAECTRNVDVLGTYLHEKRHHFQHCCYLKDDKCLGQDILDEQKLYFGGHKSCCISKKNIFSGTYGYYGRLIERDAYLHTNDQMIYLLRNKPNICDEKTRSELIKKYRDSSADFYDEEFIHWISEHFKYINARFLIEEEMLEKIKEMIAYDIGNRTLKKIIHSQKLYDALDEQLRKAIEVPFKAGNAKQRENCEKYLEKIIDKETKKRMKKETHRQVR